MIDYVYGGEFMQVSSNKGATPYINTTNPITGMMAFDGPSQSMKVFDGSSWMTVGGGTANINLDSRAISILKWAEKKMQEENELASLCEKHPTIKDIVSQMNTDIANYKNKIDMVKILIKEEEKIGTN